MLAGCRFSNAYHGSTWTVKDQPNYSINNPGDQSIDHHGKHGGDLQHKAAKRRRTDQPRKGEKKHGSDAVDHGYDRAAWVGADQHESDAQGDEKFENAEHQPDQLTGFKSKDALLAFGFALGGSNF